MASFLPRRFSFRLRSLFSVIAVVCVALALWRTYTTPNLYIEAVGERQTKFIGRVFVWNGDDVESVGMAVFYTSPQGKRSFPARGIIQAKRTSWGVYEFSQEIAFPMSPEGRCDVRIETDLLAAMLHVRPARIHWFNFGDENLPACRDESLFPYPEFYLGEVR